MLLTIGIQKTYGQDIPKKTKTIPIKTVDDRPDFMGDSLVKIPLADVNKIADSVKTDSIKPKKSPILAKIRRAAVDYEKIDQTKKQITLYNEAELYYQDIELKAGIIVLDYEKNEVYAGRIKDSTGAYTQYPVFTQGKNVVEPDSIRFNFKTKKALIWNSRTDQGEFKIKAEISKRVNDSVYFLRKARFTTAKDIEDPEYYFVADKVKFVPGKKVVVGFTNMVIADVPTPIALPFAFFPMSKESQSGVLIPTFNDTRQRGYSLQNFGYYFALSDNYDLAATADYYTNGSYAMRFESAYAWRYRFRGNINVRFENNINSERGLPDYSKFNSYNIQWSHTQDPKASPDSRFTASVNLGSSKYFQQTINQQNLGSNLNNNLSSSVSYHKTFHTIPESNLDLAFTQSQNTQTERINMTLPSLNFDVAQIYPFAPGDSPKKGFIKNINLRYNVRAQNKIDTYDSLFLKAQMFRDAIIGAQHSIPLSTNFKIFKYFSVSPTASYQENWVFKTVKKQYEPTMMKDTTIIVGGFDSYRTYSFNTNIGTTIYGTFKFGDNKKIQAIRHLMTPSVSYNYTPSFDRYYDTYQTSVRGVLTDRQYTRFENGLYGVPGKTVANSVGFSLGNTLEAKVRDKDSTKTEPKKVMLLNTLNFQTAYNFTSDSLKLSPLTINGSTSFFENKMSVNFAMRLDPYALDNQNRTINTWNIDNGGSLFRLASASSSISYTYSSRGKSKEKDKLNQGVRNGGRTDDLFGTNTDFSDRRDSQFKDDEDEETKFSEFYNSKLPWDLTLSYTTTYSNTARENKITGNSLSFSVSADLTTRWKARVSSGYDFVGKGISFTSFGFERDLLSWRLDFNWLPYGPQASWNFFIGIKSGVLSDIKWEKRKINIPNQ